MNFNDYQEEAGKTAIYPNRDSNLLYVLLGLGGEVSELIGKYLSIYERLLSDKNDIWDHKLYTILADFVENGAELERLKKIIRDSEDNQHLLELTKCVQASITIEDHDAMVAESGDIKWYSSQVDRELGVKSTDVAQWNLNKLHSRKERGKLKGSGDDR